MTTSTFTLVTRVAELGGYGHGVHGRLRDLDLEMARQLDRNLSWPPPF